MLLWLVAFISALFVLLALVAFFVPVSLSSNLQGRADPSGSWALAVGMAVGPVAFTVIAAHGVAPFLTCHVFGRQLMRLPLSRWLKRRPRKKAADPHEATPAVDFTRIERSIARFVRALDPVDTLLSWWEKDRIFEVRSLEIDVEYSFCDIALTGQILAGLCMLGGVLPERFVIHQTPLWEVEDRVALVADGKFRIWPGRLFVDVVGFVLKQRARARQVAAPASE